MNLNDFRWISKANLNDSIEFNGCKFKFVFGLKCAIKFVELNEQIRRLMKFAEFWFWRLKIGERSDLVPKTQEGQKK